MSIEHERGKFNRNLVRNGDGDDFSWCYDEGIAAPLDSIEVVYARGFPGVSQKPSSNP
jgi:hypothetical protein